jgi:hypothetical protein
LQSNILSTFGARSPAAPVLRCRNATQTSVVLEWDPIDAATASIRSLSLFRNGSKVGTIPKPESLTTTKISGLAIETEYSFQLVLRTSAGTFSSEVLRVKTHAMTDLSGITVTPGLMAAAIRSDLVSTVERIGGKVSETVRIDTTHFVCTEPRGPLWERARDMNIPVVVPDWLKGCEAEGRIVGVRQYYLDADPKLRQMGPSVVQQHNQQSQQSLPSRPRTPTKTPETKVTPPTPEQARPEVPPKDTPRLGRNSIAEEDEVASSADSSVNDGGEHGNGHVNKNDDDYENVSPASSTPPKKVTVEDAPEEDASFDEVAL